MGPDNPWSPNWRPNETGEMLAVLAYVRAAVNAATGVLPAVALASVLWVVVVRRFSLPRTQTPQGSGGRKEPHPGP